MTDSPLISFHTCEFCDVWSHKIAIIFLIIKGQFEKNEFWPTIILQVINIQSITTSFFCVKKEFKNELTVFHAQKPLVFVPLGSMMGSDSRIFWPAK